MSLNITVRPQGATEGGQNHTLPAEGDNGNQEIDTRAEAEAALAFLPENSTDTVVIGERSYTRAQLIEIRDRNAAPVEGPARPANGDTVMGDGASHGFFLEGLYTGGLGDRGHNGGGVRAGYMPRISLVNDRHRLTLNIPVGLEVGRHSTDFMTPGGERGTSAFTRGGLIAGLDLQWAPPIVNNRLWFSFGGRAGVGGFGTADSATVSLPESCTPGDFGQAECEPNAGPRTGNAGTAGLMNYDLGAARGTGGAYLYGAGRLAIGGEIVRGDWGNLNLYGAFEPGYMHVMPNDGHGFGFPVLSGILGFSGSFGGNAVERPRNPRTPDAPRSDSAPAQTRTAGEALTLADDAAVRAFGGLGADARILGVQFDSLPEDTAAPYEVPASAMTAGNHEVKIRYRNPGDTTDRIRVVPLTIGEPVRVPDGGNGSNYGAVLNMPARAARPAPDVVNGVSTARAIPVGNIQTTADFPANSTYQLYVDGNPVGTPTALPADRSTPLNLPAATPDGAHQVQLRVMRPNQSTIIYPTVAVNVGPGTATLSAGNVTSNPPGGGRYANDPVRIAITSDVATRARITIGSHTQDVDLVAGVNNITMAGAPKTWNTGGAAGRDATNVVRVQPLDTAGALTGTGVDIGSVTTRRAGSGSGRGRGNGSGGPPPLR